MLELLRDVPPREDESVAQPGSSQVEDARYRTASEPAALVTQTGLGQRAAGFGDLAELGEQAGILRRWMGRQEPLSHDLLPGPAVHAAPGVVDVHPLEIDDRAGLVAHRPQHRDRFQHGVQASVETLVGLAQAVFQRRPLEGKRGMHAELVEESDALRRVSR